MWCCIWWTWKNRQGMAGFVVSSRSQGFPRIHSCVLWLPLWHILTRYVLYFVRILLYIYLFQGGPRTWRQQQLFCVLCGTFQECYSQNSSTVDEEHLIFLWRGHQLVGPSRDKGGSCGSQEVCQEPIAWTDLSSC